MSLNEQATNGIVCSNFYTQVSDDVSLWIRKFTSDTCSKLPVIVIPGWITRLVKYQPLVDGMVLSGHPVYYIDTREKKTSKFKSLPEINDFSFENYTSDVNQNVVFIS